MTPASQAAREAAILACRITGWDGVAKRFEQGWTPEPGSRESDLLALFDQIRHAARAEAIEEAARWVEDGYCCRTCGVLFLATDAHPEPECRYPNWDRLNEEGIAAAIRALADTSPQNGQ